MSVRSIFSDRNMSAGAVNLFFMVSGILERILHYRNVATHMNIHLIQSGTSNGYAIWRLQSAEVILKCFSSAQANLLPQMYWWLMVQL